MVSLDPSKRRLQDTIGFTGPFIGDISTVLGIGERLPIKESAFQLVLCTHVLESLSPDAAVEVVRESHRVTASGGYFFVATAASDDGATTQYIDGAAGRSHLYGEAEFLKLVSAFQLIELLNLRLVRPESTPPSAQWIFIGRKS